MRHILLVTIFALQSLFLMYRAGWCAYEERYWTARVGSLGGAYEALSNDSAGIFYNTAGLIQLENKSASFSYARLFSNLSGVNLSLSQFGYVHPLGEKRRLGIGWGSFGVSDLYREDNIVLGYSEDVAQFVPEMKGNFGLGVSGRYLLRKFTLDERASADPVFKEGSSQGVFAVDVHIFLKPEFDLLDKFRFGLSLKSLNQPELGYKEKEKLPQEIVLGTAFEWKNMKIPFDLTFRSGKIKPHLGMEALFLKNAVALRAGSDLDQLGGGFGYEKKLGSDYSLVVDYGFLWPLTIESSAGSHRATIGIKF